MKSLESVAVITSPIYAVGEAQEILNQLHCNVRQRHHICLQRSVSWQSEDTQKKTSELPLAHVVFELQTVISNVKLYKHGVSEW